MSLREIKLLSQDEAIVRGQNLYRSLARRSWTGGLSIELAELELVHGVLDQVKPYRTPRRMAANDPRQVLAEIPYQMLEYWLSNDAQITLQRALEGREDIFGLMRVLDIVERQYRLEDFLRIPRNDIEALREKLLAQEVFRQLQERRQEQPYVYPYFPDLGQVAREIHQLSDFIWSDFWPDDTAGFVEDLASRVSDSLPIFFSREPV